ncbi:MAG: C69 family dipeptidase [Candidatus Zixiibacteriota bacterium]|nr:MAG: C69 family dipeptidase [candidate division Zixibacteria bacterium]
MKVKKALILTLICGITFGEPVTGAGEAENCFSIAVGKDASADGYVIMAHNEDDGPPCVVNHYKVPRKAYSPGDKVVLLNGGELDQVGETYSYIHYEIPGFLFSDSYINEFGVSIASDACPSREDSPELTDGGISYMLRALVAQRARSAREGVHIAGGLIERFGYDGSGRTYVICDPDEGWLFCAVNGKHWMAKRVPDDHVAAIANTYTVRYIDLSDTVNYLGSSDIIDYAVARGWYDPAADGEFDFAKAYADSGAACHPGNVGRHWAALRFIAADSISLTDVLPFSVVPKGKIDVAALKRVLRDHYDGTELYEAETQEECSHHRTYRSICRDDTRTSFVVQLRREMPLDLGITYWVCLGSPCTSFYLPFYFGADRFPAGYAGFPEAPDEETFDTRLQSPFVADPGQAFWTFSNFHYHIDNDFHDRLATIQEKIRALEGRAHDMQAGFESKLRVLYAADKAAAGGRLVEYSTSLYQAAMDAMAEVMAGK